MNENIFEATKEDLDNVLSFLNEREASLSHVSICEQIVAAQKRIENLKKENPEISESELKDDKEITELFENIEFWASEDNFEVSTPTVQNLDLIYAEAISFACKEANRLIDQFEEEVLDDTLDAKTEKEITESNNKLRETFNKTRDFAEKYLDDNADRYLMETYNDILKRDGAHFDFVEAEISADEEEFKWNNALADLVFEESLYDKETLAKFNEEWEVSLNPAEVLYNFIESQKTIYNEVVERFNKSSGEELSPIVAHFVEDLNSIDLENGRFSRENLIRAEELRNTREAEKAPQVDTQLNEEVGNHVSVYGINTEPLSKSYNPDEYSSNNNKSTSEENFLDRKSLLADKTAITEEDINYLLEFEPEEINYKSIERFTDKKFKDMTEDEKSNLITKLENADYKKFKNCWISTSKLLYETSETLAKEIKTLTVLNDLGYSVYLLPFGYSRNNQDFLQKSTDSILEHRFLEMKSITSDGKNAGYNAYRESRKQADNVILSFEKDVSPKIALNNVQRSLNTSKRSYDENNESVDMSGYVFLHFEKTNETELFEIDKNGRTKKIELNSFGLKNTRESTKDSQVEVEVKNESIEQPSINISQNKILSTNANTKENFIEIKKEQSIKNKENRLMEEKTLEKLEEESKVEKRNVTSPEFIRKLEDEEVSVTKDERKQILREVNSLEMSERLKMVLTVQQDFEKAEEKPRTFILTPENRDESDMDAEEIAKLLNKNNLLEQPEISEEQAECMMRYLRFNDIAVYVDQKDKFHIVDFSEDFTGESGKVVDTEGFVETVLDEITLKHGDGTDESYEHQKVLTPLIRYYAYEPASTLDIMQYLDTDDKNLARQIAEWQGGSENTGFIKDKFGNFALVVDDEIKKFKPDDVCDMVMNDFNMKIEHDKNLSELDCINLQDSVNRLWNIKADLRQVSWEQIEKLIGSKESGWVGYIKGDIENENPDFTEREIKTEVLISLLNDSLDLRGLNKYYGETGYDEKQNILYRLASEIVQSKDTIDSISLDKQVQKLYDSEVMKSKKYRNYVKEGLIKSDFYLSKLIDPALKEAMDILPGDEHDTTSEKLLESAIKSIEDEYNREGVEPDFKQLETLIKGQDAINYGIKSIDMIRPTAEEIEIGLDNDWDLKEAIKGYTKTGSSELPDGVEVVERIDVMGTFDSDYEAASQAEKDGIKMLQIKDYEHNLLEEAEDYIGLFTDTSANREFLKVREKNVERKTFTSDRDVFNNFISDVKKEYRELKLFRQATINVLKNLPEQERKIVNRELKKRGAINENSLASIMKNAVCEDKKQQKERRHKKESDVDYER